MDELENEPRTYPPGFEPPTDIHVPWYAWLLWPMMLIVIAIYCVVNVGADVRGATINLFSPIVVNNGDRRARQVINTIDGYSTRDKLFRENDSPTPVAMHESDAPNVTVLTTGG